MPDPCSNNSKDTPYYRIHSDEENTAESSVQSSSPEDGVSVSSASMQIQATAEHVSLMVIGGG
ncbi:Uncharacterised protein [Chlamydia trachomatis]|uniref:hypothetical protein n=1 Tax=Chlamydia trachomatis TaxID=813 RepID=UPI00061CB338|nr:hypothetical protein [Chlamydia trachomatis]CRH41981.1 Uncharacterised protein [Chlamydia trachomatis]CRH52546.1 Uncharacterised protein [Chlamydia trachomatis]